MNAKVKWTGVAVALTMLVQLATAVTALATPPVPRPGHLTVQQDPVLRGVAARVPRPAYRTTGRPYVAKAPVWPAGSATVALTGVARAAGPLPVSVRSAGGASRSAAAAGTGSAAGSSVTVDVPDRAQTAAAGVPGLIVKLSSPAGSGVAPVHLDIDYSTFRDGFSGGGASSLGLVELTGCLPVTAACAATPVAATNNVAAGVLSADVPATATLAAVEDPSGPAGDYTATPLKAASTWEAGDGSGDFAWQYPLRVPPGLHGPVPKLGLGYSAQSVDGEMAASNNQPSWVGEGFALPTGAIERRYVSCSSDMGGTANNTTRTGDLCWKTDNAVLTLGGVSTELLKDGDGNWHGRAEDGSRVQLRTGAANGDQDGQWWVVTETDGTQYWFGRDQLPGWASGKPVTNSVWTVPVFGNNPGEPCHHTAFASSGCDRAWRWNLDYVVDPFGNTMSLWYGLEKNQYAKAGSATTLASYVRGGWLARIDYGTRSDTAYGTAPMQVDFGAADRCLTSGCATHDATNWPDTPWTMQCTGSPCYVGSPTFWSTKRLATVTTKVGGKPVDRWTLTHRFPDPGDTTRAGLWLESISHEGLAGTTDGSRTAASVPDVHFVGVQKPNRVDATDHAPAMNWWRIASIETETGGSIDVTYSDADCVRGSRMPDKDALDTNTLRCFPAYWSPTGSDSPSLDFFHKYVVTTVTETDLGLPSDQRSVPTVTHYDYLTDPAWRYNDDDGLVDNRAKTWSQWRGYGRVRTTVGTGAEAVRTETVYFRGMDGDKLRTGNRSVTLPAAGGTPAVADSDSFAGMTREELSYQDMTGPEIAATVTVPWRSDPVASRTIDGVTVESRYVGTAETHTRTALDGGRGWRTTTTKQTYDRYGMVVRAEDLGDDAVTDDQSCTLTDYARNPTAYIMDTVGRKREFAVDCAQAEGGDLTESDVVSDTYTWYDGGARDAAPVRGAVTGTEELAGYPSRYIVATMATYDAYGRVHTATDIRGNTTTTTYTPATGGPVTGRLDVTQLGWKTTTTLDPAWGLPTNVVDPNGKSTRQTYDALGRTTALWRPNRPSNASPSVRYGYQVRKTGGSATVTSTLNNRADGYLSSVELLDGVGRVRQNQAMAATAAGGRIVSDTFYDSAGRVVKKNGGYIVDGNLDPAAPVLVQQPDDAAVPDQTVTSYDGAGRPVLATFRVDGVEKWHTTTGYGGDRTDVVPPAGSMPTSTYVDANGLTTRLRQFHGALGGDEYTELTYRYDRKDRPTEQRDNAGNVWTYGYDLLGHKTSSTGPDSGTTRTTYDDAGDMLTATDAEGRTLTYGYDSIGRKTSEHRDSLDGPLVASWTYDSATVRGTTVTALGHQVASTSYVGDAAYSTSIDGFTDLYQPTGETITIPATEPGLAGTYSYTFGYTAAGADLSTTMPALGGLPREKLTIGYNALGQADTLKTNVSATGDDAFVVDGTGYTRYGELGLISRRNGTGPWLDTAYDYETGTRRLNRILTTRETNPSAVADVRYGYDPSANVVEQQDLVAGDTQCFGYDYAKRLTEAWTPTGADCTAPSSQSQLGGPAPYWNSYTYDAVGNRSTSTERTATSSVSRSYTYPAAGAAQPHALQSVSTSGAGTATYSYDKVGNTVTRPADGSDGPAQSLTWNPDGTLAASTDPNGTTAYVYDASGERLITREPSGTTLTLPGQELRVANGQATATRYLTHAGTTVAVRTVAGLTWEVDDQQGTGTVEVDAGTQDVVRRWFTPFGAERGPAAAWLTDKGLVGGTRDGSGLTHLGAREYDPTIGRFISVDPVTARDDPQQMQGYNYASASPVTQSDPDGKFSFGDLGAAIIGAAENIVRVVTGNSYGEIGRAIIQAASRIPRIVREEREAQQRWARAAARVVARVAVLGAQDVRQAALDDAMDQSVGQAVGQAVIAVGEGVGVELARVKPRSSGGLIGALCGLWGSGRYCDQLWYTARNNSPNFWGPTECQPTDDDVCVWITDHTKYSAGICDMVCLSLEFQGGQLQFNVGPGSVGAGAAITVQSAKVGDQASVSGQVCGGAGVGPCVGIQPTQDDKGNWTGAGVFGGMAVGAGEVEPDVSYNFVTFDFNTMRFQKPLPNPVPKQIVRYLQNNCSHIWWCRWAR